ncbi:MAG: Rieske (2Fe-2S) protein [Candidatus Marinimicrobia bacterium]|nr:Rieske (2Fe-2S) protein [Candidatus Neomarinimicrobiota bacterium]
MPENGGFTPVLSVGELPQGSQRIIMLNDGRYLALFHLSRQGASRGGSGIYALDNRCLHRGGAIGAGVVTDGTVACPWHGWIFSIADGRCVDNAAACLKTYPVRIYNGEIQVDLGDS